MKTFVALLIVLAAAGARAQSPTPCLKLKKVKVENHVLHQNSETDVTLVFAPKHCSVLRGVHAPGTYWPDLEIQSEPELTASQRDLPLPGPEPAAADAFSSREEVLAKVHLSASGNLVLGAHRLPGVVHYKVIDNLGNVSDESLSFEVPITVARPEPVRLPFEERHPVWAKVLFPFEMIALFPLVIVVGLLTGWDGC